MVQIIPARVDELWNEWDVRIIVLISLCLQIVLIFFGGRRKYSTRIWVKIVIWMAYLSADWVATVALGMICTFKQDDLQRNCQQQPIKSPAIMAFWAPFLLVHLGGPDTITAFSLEDNELWLRHLLGLLVQVGVALYIFLRSWTSSTYHLSVLAIPVFVVGIFKYGERTWALWSASSERLKESLPVLLDNDADSFLKFNNDGRIMPLRVNPVIQEATDLHEGYGLFRLFSHLYADQIINYNSLLCFYGMIQQHSAQDVFRLVEIELSLMYDLLYTKAKYVYSLTGIVFRSISLLCYISTFLAFCFVDKKLFSSVDIAITYLLCVGAVALELYANVVLVVTDRTLYWLSKQKAPLAYRIYGAISSLRSHLSSTKRWSESVGQFNLMEFGLKWKSPKCAGLIPILLGFYEMYSKYRHTSSELVPIKMKQLIFEQLQDAKLVAELDQTTNSINEATRQVMSWRGNHALEKSGCSSPYVKHCVAIEVPFEKSIIMWHVATDVCFYNDVDKDQRASDPDSKSKVSKLLSDYMMYILAMCPLMLPKGIGQIWFSETRASATKFFEERRKTIRKTRGLNGKSASQVLYSMKSELDPWAIVSSNSVLLEGCALAHQLQSLETQEGWATERKWGMISQVWIEMMCHSACQSGWKEHGQQLRCGGELLTHVCLLMANLGMSEQFDVYKDNNVDMLSFLDNIKNLPVSD